MTRSSARFYAVATVEPPATSAGQRRPRGVTNPSRAQQESVRYILLGGPYISRARVVAAHPDAPRIMTAYEYDLARHRGLITWPDGTVPPEADNPQVPQWRYALEVGDSGSAYPDEREDRVYRFSSQDGRANWVRGAAGSMGLAGYRITLVPNDPRVDEMRRQVAAGEATWPDPSNTLDVRRRANQANEAARRRKPSDNG